MSKTITHVIYGLDGLLLDTESLNERVNGEILQRYNKILEPQIKIAIAGRTTYDSAKIIVNSLQLPLSVEEYILERSQLLKPLYPTAQTMPGAVELINDLTQKNIPQAIASSSFQENFECKTVNHQQWLQQISVLTFGDDPKLQNSKPAPDIFLLTAQKLNANPETCLVFEDSVAGMQAAIAAGMSVVVVPDPMLNRELFASADLILNSLVEFEPQAWGLR